MKIELLLYILSVIVKEEETYIVIKSKNRDLQ